MSAIPSPCRTICCYDARRGLCEGCGRTLDEIGAWPNANDARREEIVASAALRLLDEDRAV